jgi:hypothetical protein
MKIIKTLRERSLDVTVPALIVLLGSALPWGGSGREDRSSFELVQVADRLDVLEGAAAVVARAWLLLPFAVAVIAIAGVTGRRRLAAVLGTVVAVLAVGLALAVLRSPLLARVGVPVTMVGAALLALAGVGAIAGVGTAAPGPHEREPRTPRP